MLNMLGKSVPAAASGAPVAQPVPAYGPWRSAVVSDAGRPLGKQFTRLDRVFYRELLGADPSVPAEVQYHLLKAAQVDGRQGIRRWLTETQLDGATVEHAADVGEAQQKRLNALWTALEPPHAGFHPGTRMPRRYKGLDVRLALNNPEVRGPGWQGDTVPSAASVPPNMVLIVESEVWVSPSQQPPPEEDAAQIQDLLEHEAVELLEKGRLVDARWPFISDADRQRCLDEMEGPAHLLTIGIVEGYYGPEAERRYLRELDYAVMRQRGFGKLVDQWEKTDL